MLMKKYRLFVTLLILIVLLFSIVYGEANSSSDKVYEKFQPFFQALQYILSDYYKKDVDVNSLVNDSIRGLVKGLGDPFSHYFDPQESIEMGIQTSAEYGGLGIEVTYTRNGFLKVISPMDDTPAFYAGIKPGDIIVTIDASPVDQMTYLEAVNRLRGKKGTQVTIEILREGNKQALKFIITRRIIKLKTVKYAIIPTEMGKIGYVRLTEFSEPTASDLAKELSTLYAQDIKGLILDLRNNPGGLLSSAIDVASDFISTGKVVVSVKDRGDYEDTYRSHGNSYPALPMVVLVNGGSASAAEIVSGALKDHHRATLIGEKTFGKGSVQSPIKLSNKGELWLTVAHYFTPSGEDIHGKGIMPDIVVHQSKESTQVATATANNLAIEEGRSLTSEKANIDLKRDIQLQKAIDILKERINQTQKDAA
ncbi:MAG: S41 family peptidase [Thermotogae bacterium]|nr:S41 family peptidase [Thermotogota bacterium]